MFKLQSLKNFLHLIQSLLANIYYRFPARGLVCIGVTGTDGKTTTAEMIFHIFSQNKIKCGLISTVGGKYGEKVIDTGLHITTPDPWQLPFLLKKMKGNDVTHVVIESTSSGLDQNRLFCIKFDVSVITHIGVDHLDYHGNWINYARAKFRIILKTINNGLVVLNKDHESSVWLENELKKFHKIPEIAWFSKNELSGTNSSIHGIRFEYKKQIFEVPIIGDYNFENALVAIKASENFFTLDKISRALASFKAPSGRMEIIQTKPFSIIVDFAHTADSLDKALKSITKLKLSKNSRLICVFGCAGQRDVNRREMGRVSSELADVTIVTLEDPRDEDIAIINNEILDHMSQVLQDIAERFASHEDFMKFINQFNQNHMLVDAKQVFIFDYATLDNRYDAIKLALRIAHDDDIVFITGKGHEQSLAFGNPVMEHPYSDQGAVRKILDSSLN